MSNACRKLLERKEKSIIVLLFVSRLMSVIGSVFGMLGLEPAAVQSNVTGWIEAAPRDMLFGKRVCDFVSSADYETVNWLCR